MIVCEQYHFLDDLLMSKMGVCWSVRQVGSWICVLKIDHEKVALDKLLNIRFARDFIDCIMQEYGLYLIQTGFIQRP